jgi:lambda repressor-like predicted transcriptional regulator
VGRPRAHSDKDIEYARRLRQQGASLRTIQQRTGIPTSSLARYLTTGTTAAGKADQ